MNLCDSKTLIECGCSPEIVRTKEMAEALEEDRFKKVIERLQHRIEAERRFHRAIKILRKHQHGMAGQQNGQLNTRKERKI